MKLLPAPYACRERRCRGAEWLVELGEARTTLHIKTSMGLMLESFKSALPLPVVYPASPSARRSSSSLAAWQAFQVNVWLTLASEHKQHRQCCLAA